MENILQSYFAKYRYSLRGLLGTIYISAPENWDEDDKVFKRSKEVHGVFISLSNSLEFYKGDEDNDGGYNYLKQTYDTYGINSNVVLVKEENISAKWVETYRGYFDFSKYKRTGTKIQIMFNESGLYEKIKARKSDDLELNRLTTMDGTELSPLVLQEVGLGGKAILIINQLERKKGKGEVDTTVPNFRLTSYSDYSEIYFNLSSPLFSTRAFALPINMVTEIDGDVQTVYDYHVDTSITTYGNGDTASVFYADAKDNIDLKMNIDIDIKYLGGETPELRVDIVKYSGGVAYNYDSYISLINVNNPVQGTNYKYEANEFSIPMLIGESLALVLRLKTKESTVNVYKSSVLILDDTIVDSSTAKFILPYECLSRMLDVITDKKGILKSKAFGRTDLGYQEDGYASLTGLTNGLQIRQFEDKPITTSFESFTKSYDAVWQIGYGIEKIGRDEILRVEHKSHFYQEHVTMKLGGAPTNIERKVATDYFFSSIDVGYKKPSGEVLYEEALGLDEYNIKNSFTTAITRIEKKLINESDYRADDSGLEFARRKPKSKFPEEDTRYDLDIFLMDLKRGIGNIFQQRVWEDDFIKPIPFTKFTTGVYSPETAHNLRLSPINILLRLGFWIKGSLMKNLNEYLRYSSTQGNNLLKTKLNKPGSIEYAENGNILNSDLDKALFNPEIITFKYPVSSYMLSTVSGTTVINGDTIMNYYGLVEFINEDGNYEYGFLMSLEPNGEGNWELLSSTKKISKVPFDNSIGANPIDPYNLRATSNQP